MHVCIFKFFLEKSWNNTIIGIVRHDSRRVFCGTEAGAAGREKKASLCGIKVLDLSRSENGCLQYRIRIIIQFVTVHQSIRSYVTAYVTAMYYGFVCNFLM